MRNLLIVLSILFPSLISFGQSDWIYKKNGDSVNCQIIEMNPDYIRFTVGEGKDPAIFKTNRNLVREVIIENQKLSLNRNTSRSGERGDFNLGNRKIFKLNLLPAFYYSLAVNYEHQLAKLVSMEAGLAHKFYTQHSIIQETTTGLDFRFGIRFYSGRKNLSALEGGFLKPELIYSAQHIFKTKPSPNQLTAAYGFLLNVGSQRIYAGSLAVDFFIGAGVAYYMTNRDASQGLDPRENARSSIVWAGNLNEFGPILNIGVNIGIVAR